MPKLRRNDDGLSRSPIGGGIDGSLTQYKAKRMCDASSLRLGSVVE